MNQRIRELALQAWMAERTEKDPKYKKSEVTEYLLKDMEDFHKKFAELIVRECAKFLDENSGSDQCNNVWYPTPEEMLQHFGVEE